MQKKNFIKCYAGPSDMTDKISIYARILSQIVLTTVELI
jgi:hypothetical protein